MLKRGAAHIRFFGKRIDGMWQERFVINTTPYSAKYKVVWTVMFSGMKSFAEFVEKESQEKP